MPRAFFTTSRIVRSRSRCSRSSSLPTMDPPTTPSLSDSRIVRTRSTCQIRFMSSSRKLLTNGFSGKTFFHVVSSSASVAGTSLGLILTSIACIPM